MIWAVPASPPPRHLGQSQIVILMQVPLTSSASHRWLEDAITEWQVWTACAKLVAQHFLAQTEDDMNI